jgi:hypothetical protein
MNSNQFKPFSNKQVVQFLQSENPAPLPIHQDRERGQVSATPTGCVHSGRAVAYCGITGSTSIPCAHFLLPPAVDHRGAPSLLPEPTCSSPITNREGAPHLSRSILPGNSPARSPLWGSAQQRCRGTDLNCRLLDFQSRSPHPFFL